MPSNERPKKALSSWFKGLGGKGKEKDKKADNQQAIARRAPTAESKTEDTDDSTKEQKAGSTSAQPESNRTEGPSKATSAGAKRATSKHPSDSSDWDDRPPLARPDSLDASVNTWD